MVIWHTEQLLKAAITLQHIRVSGSNSILPALFIILLLMNASCRKSCCPLNTSGDSVRLPQCSSQAWQNCASCSRLLQTAKKVGKQRGPPTAQEAQCDSNFCCWEPRTAAAQSPTAGTYVIQRAAALIWNDSSSSVYIGVSIPVPY